MAGTALVGTALLPSFAQAQSVWGGAGATTTTNDYNLGTNWSTNPAPPTAPATSAQFGNGTGGSGGTASTAVNVTAGPITPDSWTFLANSQSYTVTGAAVIFANAATLTNNASAGQAISIANNMTGTTLNQAAASTLTISGTNSFTTTTVSGGTLANTGSLTSTVGITAGGTFSNSLTVTGAVTNGGTGNNAGSIASLSNTGGTFDNASGGIVSGASTVSGGAVTSEGAFVSTLGVSGTGSFTNNHGGTVAGTTTNTGGTVTNNTGVFGTVTNTSGTFNNTAGIAGAVTNAGTGTNGAVADIASLTNTGGTFNNSGIVTGATGASTVSGGAVTNEGSFQSMLGVSGTGSFTNNTGGTVTGLTTIATGSQATNSGGTFGAVTNNAGGIFHNDSGSAGAVSNAGTGTNGGTIASLSNTAGTFGNSGTITGLAMVSGGTLNTSGTISGGLTNGHTVNASGGAINGAISNNAGGTFNATSTITSNSTFNNSAASSLLAVSGAGNYTITGALTNSGATASGGGITIAAGGILSDTAGTTNNAAANFTNTGGTLNGGLTNSGTYTQTAGTTSGGLTNGGIVNALGGAINGAIANNAAGQFSVTGTISGNSTFTNNGTAELFVILGGNFTGITTLTNNSTDPAGVSITANSALSAANISNSAGSTMLNASTLTATAGPIGNAGTLDNDAAGSIINGGLSNTAGTTNNTGTINGGVTVSGGTLNSNTATSIVNGGLTNSATVNARGQAKGAIVNQGAGVFNVTGALVGSSTFTNNGTAQLKISGGTFSGLGDVINNSTNAAGIVISAGQGMGANSVTNNLGATVNNLGTITTAIGFLNNPLATLNTNTANSVLNGGLGNDGTVNAQGQINGQIFNNGGVFNVTGTLAGNSSFANNNAAQLNVTGGNFTGITTLDNSSTAAVGINVAAGQLLQATLSTHNRIGATINNSGTFSSVTEVQNAGTFNNLAGGTMLGGIQNNGTFLNAATASVDGGQNQSGTATNNGTITGNWGVSGGTFTGTGSVVGPTTITGGTFAPGNATPGTAMALTGSLTFQAAATYMVQINPTTSSFAAVTGTATLGGASVNAVYANGAYVAKQYTILTAGSVSGTFGATANTNLPAGFNSSLSYDATHAYLNLALNFTPPPGSGLNRNQQNVGNAIVGFFNSNGSIPLVFGGLTPAGLTQISGETATGSQQTTFNAMNQFMGVMTDPFIDGRGNSVAANGSAATGYASTQKSGAARDANAMFTKAMPAAPSFDQRWSVWAAGYGGSQTTSGNTALGSNDTTSRIYGTAVGADYRFSPFTIAGFALAGGGTNFSVANAGTGRSDLFQAGAFIRHNAGPAYITAALAYGWQDVTTHRTATVAGTDMLQARFNANAWSGRLEGGYRYATPLMGITPYAAAQFTTFELPAYAESVLSGAGTFALAYAAKSVTDSRSELGIRTDKSWALTDSIFTLRGRLAWAHDYDPNRSIGATFQTLPGASFVVNGAAQAGDSALVTASAEKKWINGWSAAATFEGEFSGVTSSYAGKGVVRYAW
jgi:uncharacterized protein with beta-barrel porin domain